MLVDWSGDEAHRRHIFPPGATVSALTIAEILVMWVLLSLLAALFFGALVDLGRDDWDD